ncbi:hypothetical protein PG995_006417 [Apiospora arundinis]
MARGLFEEWSLLALGPALSAAVVSPLLQDNTEAWGDITVAGEDGCACRSAYEMAKLPVAAGLRCKLGEHDRMARAGYGAAPLQPFGRGCCTPVA